VAARILIVKTGTTLPGIRARRGDFEDWIAAGLGIARDALRVVDVEHGEALPAPSAPAAAIVTGSSAMVSERLPWSEKTAGWLADAVDAGTPLLGICYGHQLLAHALGGRVGPNPRGREIGTVLVRALEPARRDPLLALLGAQAPVQVSHVESVLELPAGAVRLAAGERDPVQAFAIGDAAWGVQFHPEFDADVARGYIAGRRETIAGEGLDPDALLAAVRDAPVGPALLRRFAELAAERRGSG
jgi:GMP synthase (glutamine-hydrolysing)